MAGASGGWLAFTLREPQKEKLALRWLTNAGFTAILPEVATSVRKRTGPRVRITVRRLALPGYVFVYAPPDCPPGHIIADARRRVTALGRPVGMGGKPMLIPDGWDEVLLLDPDNLDAPEWTPTPGAVVSLTGAAQGYRGIVQSVTARDVRVIVEALHRALVVTVPVTSVRLAA